MQIASIIIAVDIVLLFFGKFNILSWKRNNFMLPERLIPSFYLYVYVLKTNYAAI